MVHCGCCDIGVSQYHMMSSHTSLLNFEVPSLDFSVADNYQSIIDKISRLIEPHGFQITRNGNGDQDLRLNKKQFFVSYLSPDGSDVVLRGHDRGLIALDFHEFVDIGSTPKFTQQIISKLEVDIKTELAGCIRSKSFPAIRRGDELDVYYPTVDGRLIEYDFLAELFHSTSKYQEIRINSSESLGNVLILDGDINMGESDVIYSHTLMQRGKLNYAGKTCLVLGGGDGGLLHELLQEKPKMVTMVDIDEEVLKAVRIHLRGVCGDSLDEFVGSNHEVVVGDALELLQKFVEEGRFFDYVLYDLTSMPILSEVDDNEDEWQFCKSAHSLALQVLSPGGYYLAQAHALLERESIKAFEEFLKNFEPTVDWIRHEAFIPSFHEVWAFFQIWKCGVDETKSLEK